MISVCQPEDLNNSTKICSAFPKKLYNFLKELHYSHIYQEGGTGRERIILPDITGISALQVSQFQNPCNQNQTF